jgi:hypothetical protein
MPRKSIGQELLDVPFPEMIQNMGLAIAEAQFSLDKVSVQLTQMMSGEYEAEVIDPVTGDSSIEKRDARVLFNGERLSMLELGFTPTFYQFVDTIIEVKISISMTSSTEYERKTSRTRASASGGHFFFAGKASVKASSVNARYASKYSYSAEGSSLLRTKLNPLPPPAVLEERIRALIEEKGDS